MLANTFCFEGVFQLSRALAVNYSLLKLSSYHWGIFFLSINNQIKC